MKPTAAHKKEAARQQEVLLRHAVDVIRPEEFEERLAESVATKTPLRVKAGFDPTAPDLHFGHLVLLRTLRAFQGFGHQALFVIGDFTGVIGDPSGATETRPPLTREQVAANAKTYERQVFKVLDPARTTIVFNSEWMSRMTAEELIRLAATHNVARLIEREDFRRRFAEQRPIGLHEFLYPLIQGYDSVALKADVELGGTDQTFNLLVGRELQRHSNQRPQVVIMLPLIEGTDGTKKMSKSLGNAIALEDSPAEMFGKVMSMNDTLMARYYDLLTSHPPAEITRLHPLEAKLRLATELVAQFHSQASADAARRDFDQRFRQRAFPDHPDAVVPIGPESIGPDGAVGLVSLLCTAGLAQSKAQAKRLIQQGAVDLDGRPVTDVEARLTILHGREYHLKIGKRHFARIVRP